MTSPAGAVHGGRPADAPFAGVGLLQERDGTCSAVLVSEGAVLTVAHCLGGAGPLELSWPGTPEPAQELDPRACQSVGGEVVLCRLSWMVWSVAPLTLGLDPQQFARGDALTLVGTGRTQGDRRDTGERRQGVVDVQDWTATEVKAGDEHATSCFGDSGGALVRDGRVVALATGSDGVPCLGAGSFARLDGLELALRVLLGS